MGTDFGPRDALGSPARRRFLKRLVTRNQDRMPSRQSVPSADKKPWLRLEDLATLPESLLAQIKPGPVNPLQLTESAGWVEVWNAGGASPILSFPPGSPESFLVQRFSGKLTLGDAARSLAETTCCGRARAFAETRDVFLEMVRKGLFVPINMVS